MSDCPCKHTHWLCSECGASRFASQKRSLARDLAIARAAAEWGYQYALEDDDVLTDDFTPDDNVLRAIIAQVDEGGDANESPRNDVVGQSPYETAAVSGADVGDDQPHDTGVAGQPNKPSDLYPAKETEPPQNRILADFREKYPDQHYYMRGTADEHARAVAIIERVLFCLPGDTEEQRAVRSAARAYCEEKP